MIGFGVAWVFLTGLGALLTQVSLKKSDLTAKQRQSGLILGFANVLFLTVIGLLALLSSQDAKLYSEPALESLASIDAGGWGIARGVVGDVLVDEERGFAIYAQYDGLLSSRRLWTFRGHKTLQVILEDGSQMDFEPFLDPGPSWNWHDKDDYRFLKPGDPVWVKAYFHPMAENSLSASSVEFIYRGTQAEFQQSVLTKIGKAAGFVHLALALLCLLSAIWLGVRLVRLRKQPETTSCPETPHQK